MTTPPAGGPPPGPSGISESTAARIGASIVGFAIAFVLDFVLSASLFGSSGPSAGMIMFSWVLTLLIGWVLYKIHRWALYGMLACYSALFLLTLTGGIFGPYACFAVYGYPHS